jgi:hypothetical protein
MNKVVETRRGDIFDDTASVSSMNHTGGPGTQRLGDRSFGMNTQSSQKFKGVTPKATGGR